MAEIRKSSLDLNTYRSVVLPNALRCLLVSDPTTDIAAASLDVHVGSLSDPTETQGLAHFLEHMLFMGTEKYPEENYYDSFLKRNAGSSNAYTSGEDTNYHFKVAKDKLHQALDIFGQFFIAPLFSASCTEREMNAVDSEYKKNIKNDSRRFYHLFKSTAKQGSPMSQFSTGCLETLKQPNIRESLLAFYQNHYTANRMTLAVYGAESLDELEVYVREIFSAVPNYDYPDAYSSVPAPYDGSVLSTVTRMVPIKNLNEIKLMWILPSVIGLYETKPQHYLGQLLGHEGKGSILSMLSKLNLATELSAGSEGYQFKNFSCFFIDIKLTEQGLVEYLTVLRVVGAYLALLRERGVQEWVFNETKLIYEAEFQYKSKSTPLNIVKSISKDMHRYPAEHILDGPELLFCFDEVKIKEFLNLMTPENCRVYLLSQSYADCTDQASLWYGTQYRVDPFSSEIVEALNTKEFQHQNYVLDLPPRNPYIPTNLEVLPPGTEALPKLIFSDQGQLVWHKQDDTFKRNKMLGLLNIETNELAFPFSDFTRLVAKIWIKLFNEKFREEDYMASQAGLQLSYDIEPRGISLGVDGFSQNSDKYFQRILQSLVALEISEEDQAVYEVFKREVERSLSNHYFSQPYTQCFSTISDIRLVHGYSPISAMQKILSKITLQDVIGFNKTWLARLRLEWLILGNMTAEEALAMTEACSKIFRERGTQFMPEDERTGLRHVIYPMKSVSEIKSNLYFEKYLFDDSQPDSAVLCEWQFGHANLQAHAALLIIENYLKEPCFNTLRTQEQLGYLVFSGLTRRRLVLSYYICVESPVACCAKLNERVSAFMQKMVGEIRNLTQESFEEYVNSVHTSLTKKDTSLKEQFEYFQSELQMTPVEFENRVKLAEAVRNTTKEQMLEVFDRLFLSQSRRLDIELVSHAHRTEQDGASADRDKVTNIAKFRRTLAIFPEVPARL